MPIACTAASTDKRVDRLMAAGETGREIDPWAEDIGHGLRCRPAGFAGR